MDSLQRHNVAVSDLAADASSQGLRGVKQEILLKTAELIDESQSLIRGLRSRRLAMESAAIIRLAEVLVRRLRRQDPVARRVELSKPMALWVAGTGVLRYWLGR